MSKKRVEFCFNSYTGEFVGNVCAVAEHMGILWDIKEDEEGVEFYCFEGEEDKINPFRKLVDYAS